MNKAWNSDTMECIRGGVKDGMENARTAAKRMRFRSPVVYRNTAGETAGRIGLALLIAGVLAGAAWLLLRKRKEAGAGAAAGEGMGEAWEADQVPVSGPEGGVGR